MRTIAAAFSSSNKHFAWSCVCRVKIVVKDDGEYRGSASHEEDLGPSIIFMELYLGHSNNTRSTKGSTQRASIVERARLEQQAVSTVERKT